MNGQQQHLEPASRERFGGWTITCSHPDCRETTADQAPSPYWRTDEDRAATAAKKLGWIHTRDPHGDARWVCPLHQAWDPDTRRWIAAPQGRQEAAFVTRSPQAARLDERATS